MVRPPIAHRSFDTVERATPHAAARTFLIASVRLHFFSAMLLARECHPDAIIYTSKETHYSIFKAARYYRMDCLAIPTLPMGEIDYNALTMALAKHKDRHAIINVNIGTTVKGAVDNLDRILRILRSLGIERERYHIHWCAAPRLCSRSRMQPRADATAMWRAVGPPTASEMAPSSHARPTGRLGTPLCDAATVRSSP
eukprot:SAG11_NODE_2054_length_3878_cov_1.867161_2_plen_198_part_00